VGEFTWVANRIPLGGKVGLNNPNSPLLEIGEKDDSRRILGLAVFVKSTSQGMFAPIGWGGHPSVAMYRIFRGKR